MISNKLQHIGVIVPAIQSAIDWYVNNMCGKLLGIFPDDAGEDTAFVEVGGILLEIYEGSQTGIDHFAFDVSDIQAAYAEAKFSGMKLIEQITPLEYFWEKGCSFFMVEAGGGIRIEYNQINK